MSSGRFHFGQPLGEWREKAVSNIDTPVRKIYSKNPIFGRFYVFAAIPAAGTAIGLALLQSN